MFLDVIVLTRLCEEVHLWTIPRRLFRNSGKPFGPAWRKTGWDL